MKGIDAIAFIDERTGKAPLLRKALRYVFPEHWSFLLGEIALYSFLVLVATGIYLTLFFEPSLERTTYEGGYDPLHGVEMSKAYASTLALSFDVRAGLLMRQTHHWAANVFVAAIVLHLMRVFFTGAFRKPRDVTYYVGVTMLALAVFEGFLGYSLIDDLLSGMGLAIAYAVVLSIPVIGGDLGLLIWGAEYPGQPEFLSRVFIGHVLLLPVAIATLIALHLLLVTLTKHGQFRMRGRTEHNVIGAPMWPSYALRSGGLMLSVAAALFLMGGLIQINPVWLWGPFETWLATNGAQPDWYMGWLIGTLRIVPPAEPSLFGWTLFPNPFFGGVLWPGLVFVFLYLWPAIERRVTGDRGYHHMLDRPRDNPLRTAVGWALLTMVAIGLFAGTSDRVMVQVGIDYKAQIWFYRGAFFVAPAVAFAIALKVCRELRAHEQHPALGEEGTPGVGKPEHAPAAPPAHESG